MKKWWKNFINSDQSTTVFIVLVFVLTFAVVYFAMSSEKYTVNENGKKVHYSHPIKDRAHGGFGYGFGYSPRTHRFGFGFGTGTINFH